MFKQQNGQQNSNFKNADLQKAHTIDFDKKLSHHDFGANLLNNYTNLSLKQIMNGQGTTFKTKDFVNLGRTSIRLDDKETYRKMLNNSQSNNNSKKIINDFTKNLLLKQNSAVKKNDFSFLLKKNDALIKNNWYNTPALNNRQTTTNPISSFYKPFAKFDQLGNTQFQYGKRISLLENLKKIDELERSNFSSQQQDCIDLENDLNNVVQRTLVVNKQFNLEYDDNHFGNISKGTSSLCISEAWEDIQNDEMEVDFDPKVNKLSAPVDIHDKNFADNIAKKLEALDDEQNRILKEKENKYKEIEENTRLTIQELEKISKDRIKSANVSKLKYYPPCYDIEKQDDLSDIEYPPEDDELSDLEDLKEEDEEIKLTSDILDEVERILSINNMNELITEKYNCEIRRKDIETLQGLNWLNDEIINFYFNMIMERSPSDVYCFNTFFYTKLKESGHKMLKRWTKKVDIFSFKLILIPVHLDVHWVLASIDMVRREINYYDSMSGNNRECLKLLLIYLQDEMIDKKKEALDVENWKLTIQKGIPQQMNGSDCGMFACKYADYLSRNKKFTFNQVILNISITKF